MSIGALDDTGRLAYKDAIKLLAFFTIILAPIACLKRTY